MNYLALIGDIRDSRQVSDRAGLQKTLQRVLAEINQRYAQSLLSPFTITLGDEFQALLPGAGGLWLTIAIIQAELYPVRVRFGIGLGEIVTEINHDAALGMDGPAFHRARDAITLMKDQGGYYRLEGLPQPALANQALVLLSHLQDKWHKNRFAIFRAYLAGVRVEDIATDLEISKVAVYNNINDGLLATFKGVQEAIAQQIDDALGVGHGV